jgi:hypothetical protein
MNWGWFRGKRGNGESLFSGVFMLTPLRRLISKYIIVLSYIFLMALSFSGNAYGDTDDQDHLVVPVEGWHLLVGNSSFFLYGSLSSSEDSAWFLRLERNDTGAPAGDISDFSGDITFESFDCEHGLVQIGAFVGSRYGDGPVHDLRGVDNNEYVEISSGSLNSLKMDYACSGLTLFDWESFGLYAANELASFTALSIRNFGEAVLLGRAFSGAFFLKDGGEVPNRAWLVWVGERPVELEGLLPGDYMLVQVSIGFECSSNQFNFGDQLVFTGSQMIYFPGLDVGNEIFSSYPFVRQRIHDVLCLNREINPVPFSYEEMFSFVRN